MMENAVMVGVLLAVVGVGLFGLYYAQSPEESGTLYYPIVTGMGTPEIVVPTDVNLYSAEGGITTDNGTGNFNTVEFDAKLLDPINPTIFDSFGNCVGCEWFNLTKYAGDYNYNGTPGNNVSLCGIIGHDGTTYLNLSMKLNESLPSGWNYEKITAHPYNRSSVWAGTNILYPDTFLNGTFDRASSLDMTTNYQQVVTNWSDGTGLGDPDMAVDIACEWSLNPYTVGSGTFTITNSYIVVNT